MPNLYCDNFVSCHEVVFDRGDETESVARAKGWHMYKGTNLPGNRQLLVTLGPKCIGARRRELAPAPEVLDGQLDLF